LKTSIVSRSKLKLVVDRTSPARRAGKAVHAAQQHIHASRERLVDSQEFLDDTCKEASRPAPSTHRRDEQAAYNLTVQLGPSARAGRRLLLLCAASPSKPVDP
jgi:hypothetical protein